MHTADRPQHCATHSLLTWPLRCRLLQSWPRTGCLLPRTAAALAPGREPPLLPCPCRACERCRSASAAACRRCCSTVLLLLLQQRQWDSASAACYALQLLFGTLPSGSRERTGTCRRRAAAWLVGRRRAAAAAGTGGRPSILRCFRLPGSRVCNVLGALAAVKQAARAVVTGRRVGGALRTRLC